MNQALATHILDQLFAADVRELCLCAGARNSPLVSLASQDTRFKTYNFFEERSASFFALGRIKANGQPAAIVTTSGTAAGELLPATMEAYYSSLPLVLVTADRPRLFRGTGAPQTAEQAGLFGIYASPEIDIAGDERMDSQRIGARPVHINVCFDEPLPGLTGATEVNNAVRSPAPRMVMASDSISVSSISEAAQHLHEFLNVSHAPVVIVGALTPQERPPALAFLKALGAPVILESLSGLREHPALQSLSLRSGKEALVPRSSGRGGTPWMDGVLRVGSVPTLRLWRDLEDTFRHLPTLSLSAQPFSGTSRGGLIYVSLSEALGVLAAQVSPLSIGARMTALMERDQRLDAALLGLLESEPCSEPGLIYRFSQALPANARIFLGNSLPIREWDLAAMRNFKQWEMGASRGLNGIDGQISTFLGFSQTDADNWALLGDLTALYDMAAPWILRQMPDLQVRIVIINNGGGKIFDRMFESPVFQNRHTLSFGPLAGFWGLGYERWETVPEAADVASLPRQCLVEIVPDDAATKRFWMAYDTLSVDAGGTE